VPIEVETCPSRGAGVPIERDGVRDGFAVYEDNPAHRRAKLVRLTPQGRSALQAIQAAQRAWADALGAELGEAELRQAGAFLNRVIQALRTPA
jgi:DNA-binding MarR family transcriptional regulator